MVRDIEHINKDIFRSYDFRGIYPREMNEEAIRVIALGYIKLLSEKKRKPIKELKILMSKDARNSSDALFDAAKRVFLEYGVTVHSIGSQSINDYYFAVGKYKYDGGFMATASHNPSEYGGCKLAYYGSEELDNIEFVSGKELLSYLENLVKENELPLRDEKVPGSFVEKDYSEEHLAHILKFVNLEKVKPLKVVIDIGNGMNGRMAKKVFDKLPCEAEFLFTEPNGDFPNRAPNPLTKGASDKAALKIKEIGADFGLICDVDGDRVNLIDENGKFYEGDMTLLPMAKAMLENNPGEGIVYNLISSHCVKDFVKEWGGKPIRSEVGYMNLARHMRDEGGIMSGEVSAHFAFRDSYYADNAFIAMVLILQAISEENKKVSEIMKEYTIYHRASEVNFTVSDRESELEKFREKYKDNLLDEIDGLTFEFDEWWFNVRPSGTEPLVRLTIEAKTKELAEKKLAELTEVIHS